MNAGHSVNDACSAARVTSRTFYKYGGKAALRKDAASQVSAIARDAAEAAAQPAGGDAGPASSDVWFTTSARGNVRTITVRGNDTGVSAELFAVTCEALPAGQGALLVSRKGLMEITKGEGYRLSFSRWEGPPDHKVISEFSDDSLQPMLAATTPR